MRELPFNPGNITYLNKLSRNLNEGMRKMRRMQNQRKTYNQNLTYYLLRDGSVVSLREWRHLGNPIYIVAGSKNGCESHWARTINIQ
jgi:hypothetical protein